MYVSDKINCAHLSIALFSVGYRANTQTEEGQVTIIRLMSSSAYHCRSESWWSKASCCYSVTLTPKLYSATFMSPLTVDKLKQMLCEPQVTLPLIQP